MKKFLLVFFLPFVISVEAQTFRFGLNLSPTRSDNFICQNGENVPDAVMEVFKENEVANFGSSAFIFTDYALNSRAGLRIGLIFG